MKKITLVLLLIFFGLVYADRTVWYVHPDSTLNSIQAGLDSCADNDMVLVGPGTYVENIVWPNTQGIHLISEAGLDTTVIDGGSTGRVISMNVDVDTTTVIIGFTVCNGYANTYAGGILCEGASPTIIYNIIMDNIGDLGGGVACTGNSAAHIDRNTIATNTAYVGGGIYCHPSCSIKIIGNTITNNFGFYGGGISCGGSGMLIAENTITMNSTDAYGGGIYCIVGSPRIVKSVIAQHYDDGIFCWNSAPIIDSCQIFGNRRGIFCGGGANPIINYNNISDNYRGLVNHDESVMVNAKYNWWGDASGPYHSDSNPGGQGDTVSDYVDFTPWLDHPVGVEEKPAIEPIETHDNLGATIFSGPLHLPKDKKCRILDITGRVVEPDKITRGIYFVEIEGVVTQKVVKVR